jgi:hypothetical protein
MIYRNFSGADVGYWGIGKTGTERKSPKLVFHGHRRDAWELAKKQPEKSSVAFLGKSYDPTISGVPVQ